MLVQYTKQANIGIGVGIVMQIAARAMASGSNEPVPLALVLALAGLCSLVYGCGMYAKAKGHSPFLGALGILSLLGFIILYFLPDRHK